MLNCVVTFNMFTKKRPCLAKNMKKDRCSFFCKEVYLPSDPPPPHKTKLALARYEV